MGTVCLINNDNLFNKVCFIFPENVFVKGGKLIRPTFEVQRSTETKPCSAYSGKGRSGLRIHMKNTGLQYDFASDVQNTAFDPSSP